MTVWFVEYINTQDRWVPYTNKYFYSFMEAYRFAKDESFNDDRYYWRINQQKNYFVY